VSLWKTFLCQQINELIVGNSYFLHLAYGRIEQEHHLGILCDELSRCLGLVHQLILAEIQRARLVGKPIEGDRIVASCRTRAVDWLDAG